MPVDPPAAEWDEPTAPLDMAAIDGRQIARTEGGPLAGSKSLEVRCSGQPRAEEGGRKSSGPQSRLLSGVLVTSQSIELSRTG